MAIIKPFKAYRPIEELASKIAALPYDVMNTEEAREMAKGNKYSFLYVDRGEINFPEKVNIYGEEVYKESREVLDKMIENKYYFQDKNSYFYIYRQTMNGKSQVGLVVCASVDDYINNVIKKHEKTRADKELDRINHVDYCDAHTGPIFLTYRENNDISKIINESIKEKPVYDYNLVPEGEAIIIVVEYIMDEQGKIIQAYPVLPAEKSDLGLSEEEYQDLNTACIQALEKYEIIPPKDKRGNIPQQEKFILTHDGAVEKFEF